MTRRELVALLAGSSVARAFQVTPDERRTVPLVCLQSSCLKAIEYTDLGDIARQLGAEGVDLTVMPGGHVEPRNSSVDLVRALEVMQGQGLDVPIVSTALTTPVEYTSRAVLALSGMTGVRLFRTGYWRNGDLGSAEQRTLNVRREVLGLAAMGREYNIAPVLHNRPGWFGQSVREFNAALAGMNPVTAGLCFDPGNAMVATGGWENELKLALPKLRAVAVRDVTGGGKECAMGKGVIDFPRFFQALARAGFAGPLSVYVDYAPTDVPGAVSHDLDFVKRAVREAYPHAMS